MTLVCGDLLTVTFGVEQLEVSSTRCMASLAKDRANYCEERKTRCQVMS